MSHGLAGGPSCALELQKTVDLVVPRLLAIEDSSTARRPSPEKWSPREIIGHLIDSASNNHQRFVRAQWVDALVFDGYEQDRWVTVQRYHEAPWDELVMLWASFNRHLSRVMRAAPEAVRSREHRDHNLDRIAFRPVSRDAPATLGYLMADYVEHLRHHLRQIPGIDL